MARLSAAARKKLPTGKFALPSKAAGAAKGKYPIPDKAHAANAKARATQQVAKGNLSPAAAQQVKAKANKVLGKQAGGSTAMKKAAPKKVAAKKPFKPARKPKRR